MSIYKLDNSRKVEKLFKGWNETMIYSYLDGCMGTCYVDDIENPKSAQIIIADFCFMAGKPCRQLIKNIKSEFVIMVPQSKEWSHLIEDIYGIRATRKERYATLKENAVFDKEYLELEVSKLNEKYEIKEIDEDIYNEIIISSYKPFYDLCGQFLTYQDYDNHGLGFVIKDGSEIVAGASSYTYYHGGIEIEVDTHPDYRQQGLAKVCSAKLILECLKRHLYPSWDAHNTISLSLAIKLGYHFDKAYPVYEIISYTNLKKCSRM